MPVDRWIKEPIHPASARAASFSRPGSSTSTMSSTIRRILLVFSSVTKTSILRPLTVTACTIGHITVTVMACPRRPCSSELKGESSMGPEPSQQAQSIVDLPK